MQCTTFLRCTSALVQRVPYETLEPGHPVHGHLARIISEILRIIITALASGNRIVRTAAVTAIGDCLSTRKAIPVVREVLMHSTTYEGKAMPVAAVQIDAATNAASQYSSLMGQLLDFCHAKVHAANNVSLPKFAMEGFSILSKVARTYPDVLTSSGWWDGCCELLIATFGKRDAKLRLSALRVLEEVLKARRSTAITLSAEAEPLKEIPGIAKLIVDYIQRAMSDADSAIRAIACSILSFVEEGEWQGIDPEVSMRICERLKKYASGQHQNRQPARVQMSACGALSSLVLFKSCQSYGFLSSIIGPCIQVATKADSMAVRARAAQAVANLCMYSGDGELKGGGGGGGGEQEREQEQEEKEKRTFLAPAIAAFRSKLGQILQARGIAWYCMHCALRGAWTDHACDKAMRQWDKSLGISGRMLDQDAGKAKIKQR